MKRLAPLVLLLVGCGATSDLLAHRQGRAVTVRVRPDMLGMSADLPTSVGTDSLNGSELSITGKLVASDDRWVTVAQPDGTETVIARGAVLSVVVRPSDRD